MPPLADRRIAAALAASAALLVASCSVLPGGSDDATTTTTDPVRASARTAQRYLDALHDGDLDAANDERCTMRAVRDEDAEVFLADFERFEEAAGPITIDVVRPHPRSEGSIGPGIDITYAYDGVAAAEPVSILMATEQGRPVLCGLTDPPGAMDLGLDGLVPADAGGTDLPLGDLLPDLDAEGWAVLDDLAAEPDPGRYEEATAGRRWRSDDGGSAAVFLTRYTGEYDAKTVAADLLADQEPDAVGTAGEAGDPVFTIQTSAYSWLWVQAPDQGPLTETVVLLMGDTVAVVQDATGEVGEAPDIAPDLAAQILSRAGLD